MSLSRNLEDSGTTNIKGTRSHSAQGLPSTNSPAMKIPFPPRLWITDVEDESSDDMSGSVREEGVLSAERPRVRSRFRHHKQRSLSVPIGIFWDIENCQVPRGCSAIDVVAAIRNKFLPGRREADFVVVCDVRKEAPSRLQELNDAQVSLIHVCGTQKNAADEKLRQCMRRFGELHSAPAALLLISGDINFAADLSDFRHRKNMEVILVHKQNTSSALITCASSHYCYNDLTALLPRNPKISQTEEDEEPPTCEMEVTNLPVDHPPERVSRRLRRLADNCGGKVLRVTANTAVLRFPTPDHASRALKRMDGEDVFGRKITTRYARSVFQSAYSSDEGYGTAPPTQPPHRAAFMPPINQQCYSPREKLPSVNSVANDWALALQQLPAPTPPPLDFCPPPAPKPRKIRGTHGSTNLDRSGCSSSNSCDESRRDNSQSRAMSPWNSSASFSEQSEGDSDNAELTVSNLPPFDPTVLQEMLTILFDQYVPVVRVSIWAAGEGPLATVVLRSEWDARLAIARIHKRRLDNQWTGRRLELSLGRPSPAPNLDVLRARLRAILLDQKNYTLPLLRLRDAYASRHCCALTTSDIAKVKDTVIIHEGFGRMVQLIDLNPVSSSEMEAAPWKCHIHTSMNTGHEDGSRILQPVYIEVAALAKNVQLLLENHGGVLPLLTFVECYEATFMPLMVDVQRGVALELLLRSVPGVEVKDSPSRHLTWRTDGTDTPPSHSESSRSSERERGRTAPALEPILALFERELIDLLRTAPRCTIAFSKLIPAFHHHFGRQCRVADYGFTKLPDLLAALSNTIVVLGSGSSRVITISAAAQSRRWTSDLVKLLKAQPGRVILPMEIPELYQSTFGRLFSPVDYGLCTLKELMQRVAPQAVIVDIDGTLSLPRRTPTPEERARTVQFAVEAVELLCYTPNLRMEFSRFVPAYHAHFGRQLRVAHYGCVKLVELLELIPEAVVICVEPNGDRTVRLGARAARAAMAQRLRAITPIPLSELSTQYAAQFGALPLLDMLDVTSLELLVYAAGGCLQNGIVVGPGAAPSWATAMLAACAVLSADRSVARGSTDEYFASAFRRMRIPEPDVRHLAAAGVVETSDRRIRLTPTWRTVWRLAQLLADCNSPTTVNDILAQYMHRYESVFPCADLGVWSLEEFLRQYQEVFTETSGMGRWSLCEGVTVSRYRDLGSAPTHEDYTLHDTPPGQKGSRVFESPKVNIWCSPPASALPAPTALLTQEKRRTRLAAHFDVS
ncbi:meiosis regulator and mRNA stability factor 1-like [Achroia grisella]|uniref:meiosis regulator and mRNA stability factor 1-like n=1 Tax=Achroia grisella TaxID=688607 RepID=UPI0027D345CD|nr:meiosis regulator and mRNA stability factor 1-like [Achroia grisella]